MHVAFHFSFSLVFDGVEVLMGGMGDVLEKMGQSRHHSFTLHGLQ